MARKPETSDEYLAAVSADKRAAVKKLPKAIKATAPGVEEDIICQLPAFRFDGKMVVGFGAAARHRSSD